MASCPACGGLAAEGARFCSACGSPLPHRGARATQARKTVTVLFADVSGFTSLGERLDPETLQEVMSRYFAEMRRVIAHHGGRVEKLIGDAIMAVFGVPVVHEDDALRAARAALEMQAALDRLNDELHGRWDVRLQIHTGVNSGVVVVGADVAGEQFAYGDTVNVAQRLEGAAAPGEILVGPLTAVLLDGTGALSRLPPMRLKGKAAPVEAWRLEAIDEQAERRKGRSPEFVARELELATLAETFERVTQARRPAVVTIVGAPGIGKSRLARAMLDAVAPDAEVVVGRCLQYGEGITYGPLAEIVRRLAGRTEERAVADAAGGGTEARMIAERLVRVIGTAAGGVAIEEGQWAARRLLELRAARQPLVVAIDDLHWAQPTFVDLLEHVVTFANDVPLLFVCMARPEFLDERPNWLATGRHHTVIEMSPLDDRDAAVLVDRLTNGAALDRSVVDEMLATAEGNPFFLEQIVAMRADPGQDDAGMPASIHALLAARIDTLPPPERAVLDRAAVEGRSFHRSAIAELLEPTDRRVLDASLDALARRQLIRPGPGDLPGEAGYHFSHILVRDVAYDLLPKSERAALHERYAAWLDRRAGARYAELVGYHFEQAHRLHEELRPRAEDERRTLASAAVARLGQAGRAALERGDLPGGINLLERTAALIEPGDPRSGEVLPELGLALVNVGNLSRAETVLVDAAQAASAADAPLAEARARVAQFFVLVQLDPEVAAHELSLRFDLLRDTFTAAGDDRGLARLWGGQALIHWLAGATQRAAAAWDRSLRYALRAGDQTARADALVWLASAARVGSLPVPRAIAQCEGILHQLESDRRSQAQVMRSVACLRAMAGDFNAAVQLFDRSTAIHAELGVSMHAAVSQEEAFVHMVAGEPAKAEAVLRDGCEQLEKMGERALLSTTAGMLAQALIELGRFDEALSLSEVAEEMAAPDDLSANILYRTTRAQVLAHHEEFDVADRLSLEAVQLGDGTDCLVDRGDAHMARGRVLRTQARMEDAAIEFSRAHGLYALKGNVASCRRAEAALEAAGAPTVPR